MDGQIPLTAHQLDIWAASQLSPDSPQFNICGYEEIEGPLDVALYLSCLRRAVERNEALRLRFDETDGTPYQWVADEPVEIPVIDLSQTPDPRAACQAWIRDSFERPFALRNSRMYDIALLRQSDSVMYSYLNVHHLVIDGWGGRLLMRQIWQDYRHARKHGELPNITVPSYLDTLAAKDRYRGSAQHADDLAYYETALAGVTPALFPRRNGATRPTGRYTFTIEPDLVARIRDRHGSPFAFVAAALAVYLTRVHRSDEVVLGVPVLNRRDNDQRRVVGQFANELPLRVRTGASAGGRPTMRELVADIQQSVRELRAHEQLPANELLRLPSLVGSGGGQLHDVTLSWMRWPKGGAETGVRRTAHLLTHAHDRDTLALLVNEFEDGGPLVVDVCYARDVFDTDFPIEAFGGHLVTLLANALDAGDAPLATVPMLTPEERERLVHGLNPAPSAYPDGMTLHGLFEEQAARTPSRLAVLGAAGSEALTYAQLDARANQVAQALRHDGIGPDDRVAILTGRDPSMLIAILGVLKAGGAYVPIDPTYPAERIRFLLADSGAKVALVTAATSGLELPGVAVRDVEATTDLPDDPVPPLSGPDNLAYVIYTSGSTGRPKGVLVEHRSVVNRLAWMQRRYPLGEHDTLLQKTPVTFDVSVWELFWWSLAGARLALAPTGVEKDPQDLLRSVTDRKVTVLHFVPSMLGPFLDALEATPRLREEAVSLRYVFCSGEELPRARVEQFNRILGDGPRLVNLYGPTEATVDVSYYDCPHDPAQPVTRVPIGRPIDNVRLYVLGVDGEPQPVGAPGELCVGGVAVARGYLNRPELTAEKFANDPFAPGQRLYRTGDLARWLADGNLEYLGRTDSQVKVRGNRIELGEVQHRLAEHPAIRDAVVVDRRSAQRGVHLVGYYVADVDLDPVELRQHLAETLPEFMIPSFFARIPAVPFTPHGKLDRAALPDPTGHLAPASGPIATPRDGVEAVLAEIWSEVLGVAQVGVHDNYYAIGGDSILALRIRAEAEKRGLYFATADLVQNPTVAELATRVASSPPTEASPATHPFELVAHVDRARLAGAQDAYPATQMALGLLYHSREHEVSASYRDVFRYSLRMPWDEAAFRTAYARLTARHPALRSAFDLSSFTEPLQIIQPEVTGGLDVVDLRSADEETANAEILAHMRERRFHRYELDRPPLYLIRAHVLRSSVELVFSFHHVILDGWSVATLIRDLLQDYLHLLGMDIAAVPADPLPSPAAFAAEERRALASAEHRRFWSERLANAEVTQIEGMRQYEPPGDEEEINVRIVEVPADLHARIRRFAQDHAVPVKSILLAAHCLTLRLFSGSTDVTTGLVTHGRTEQAGADRIAGLFLNTMPLRVNAAPGTWLDMVHEVHRQERECHPYRRYPLHAIQQDLGRPVLEAVFNFVHLHLLRPVLELPGVALLNFETWEQTNFAYLLNVFVTPAADRMALRVDTDGRIFTQAQTDLVVDTYLRVLGALLDQPESEIDFAFLAEPSTEVVPAREPASTIVDRLERHFAATPDAIAVAAAGQEWTYAEFDRITARIARRLITLGARPGDRIGIALERSPELIAAIYGIARAGAACVPLDVTYPEERIAAMVDQAAPMRIIAHQRHAHLVRDQSIVLLIDEMLAGADDPSVPLPRIDPDSLLYVLFTSGSTGAPKGVAMPHRALDNYQIWQVNAASGAAGGKTLQFAPISFDVSFQEIYSTISGGGTLQIISEDERRDMPALLRLLDREGVERVFLPYVALQQLAETADLLGIFPRRLRVVISSGEQLRVTAEIRRFMAGLPAGAVLENQYGPTETHLVTAHLMEGDPAKFPNLPPIGSVTDGVECHLLDERMRPVPRGVAGELYFGGVQLADGYFGRDDLTRQRFIPNPFGPPGSRLYRTGDIARRMPSGHLMWIARADTQTKIRGFRVEPLEVEIAIMRLAEQEPGISEAAVVARRREGVDSFLAAFLVGDPDAVDLQQLRKRLRASLPDYMVPSYFGWLPAMPLTPSGKRDDAALRRMPLSAGVTSAQTAPRDEYEQALVEIIADLLELPSVGADDDFFELGGTSLTAMRLVVMVEKRYGVSIPVSTFVSAPTAAGLADVLRTGGARFVFDPVVPIRAEGDRPPVFLVHPIGGNVLCYLRLARYLPTDQPVYALQAPGGEIGTEAVSSVEELARGYLEAIARIQPRGPYAIGGWSFGGMVAFEMARQLRQRGEEVGQLLLIDTIVRRPGDPASVSDRTLLEWFFWELLLLERNGPVSAEPLPSEVATFDDALDFVTERAVAAGVLRPGTSRGAVTRLYQVFKAHWRAIVEYRPEVTDLDVTLLRAVEPLPAELMPMHEAAGGTMHSDPKNGWGELTTGRIEVLPMPGDHLLLMEEPYVAEVARAITERLTGSSR